MTLEQTDLKQFPKSLNHTRNGRRSDDFEWIRILFPCRHRRVLHLWAETINSSLGVTVFAYFLVFVCPLCSRISQVSAKNLSTIKSFSGKFELWWSPTSPNVLFLCLRSVHEWTVFGSESSSTRPWRVIGFRFLISLKVLHLEGIQDLINFPFRRRFEGTSSRFLGTPQVTYRKPVWLSKNFSSPSLIASLFNPKSRMNLRFRWLCVCKHAIGHHLSINLLRAPSETVFRKERNMKRNLASLSE